MGKNEELDSKLQQTRWFYLVIKRTLDEEEAGYWGANWCRGQEEHAPGINGTWKWDRWNEMDSEEYFPISFQ